MPQGERVCFPPHLLLALWQHVIAGAVGSSSLRDGEGSSSCIKWVQELPVLGVWYAFELLV